MIKENKKNKIITFLCACLMVCASALGLVNAVGTTLASSPNPTNVTTSTFNFKNENFTSQFDFYFTTSYVRLSFYGSEAIDIQIYDFNGNFVSTLFSDGSSSGNMHQFSGLSHVYTIENNALVSDTCGITNGSSVNRLIIGNTTNSPYINVDNYNRLANNLIVNFYDTNTSTYYLMCSYGLYNLHNVYYEGVNSVDTSSAYNNGYNVGFQDGYTEGYEEGELEGYENGYQDGVDFGFTQGVNAVLNNPNNYGLYTQAQYQQNYTDGYNAGYNSGYIDGQQSTDLYQNGFNDGIDEVLNNPNNYDLYTEQQFQQNYSDGINYVLNNLSEYNLYTKAQYEQNYEDGFIQGVASSQYGVFANVRITGGFGYQLTDNTTYAVSISNEDFNFANGVIIPKQTLIDKYNIFMELLSQQSNVRFKQAYINFNDLNFIYNSDIDINFVNLNSLNDTSTAFFYATVNDSNGFFCRTYTPILDNGIVVGYNIVNYDNIVEGSLITEIRYNLFSAPPVVNDVVVPGNYILKPNNLLVYEKSIAFDNGYDVGYADGTNSEVVNNAYNNGYDKGSVEGFNSGYAQGLANQDNATFASMISAVIDVPINAMRNLFNFDLLGINLFGFFTALFTLLVVITIIRLILGGK